MFKILIELRFELFLNVNYIYLPQIIVKGKKHAKYNKEFEETEKETTANGVSLKPTFHVVDLMTGE